MEDEQTQEGYLKEAENRIDWVLSHSGMSDWLKQALHDARARPRGPPQRPGNARPFVEASRRDTDCARLVPAPKAFTVTG